MKAKHKNLNLSRNVKKSLDEATFISKINQ
jgi:hypothetical protein